MGSLSGAPGPSLCLSTLPHLCKNHTSPWGGEEQASSTGSGTELMPAPTSRACVPILCPALSISPLLFLVTSAHNPRRQAYDHLLFGDGGTEAGALTQAPRHPQLAVGCSTTTLVVSAPLLPAGSAPPTVPHFPFSPRSSFPTVCYSYSRRLSCLDPIVTTSQQNSTENVTPPDPLATLGNTWPPGTEVTPQR